MSGADLVKVTPRDQSLSDYGVGEEKTSSDLMDADVAVTWTGTDGKVTGNFPKVTGFKGFSDKPEEQEGHYFCFVADARFEGQKLTVIGAHQKTAQDRKWVIRLDELYESSKKLTVKAGGETIFTLDFSGATMGE